MSDPKKVSQLNALTLFTRNRYTRVTGIALVPVVLLGIFLLTSRPSSHPGPLANANLPDSTSSPLQTATPPFVLVSPSASPTPKKAHPSPTPPTQRVSPRPNPGVTGVPHVMVIIEENKGYAATLGSCGSDPYLCSLAAAYSSATAWFGISHPSEPNYVAIASGGIQGCVNDGSCPANSLSVPDLGGQLTASRIPWVGWMESMPSACATSGSSGGYALKHNPFGFFKDNYTGTCHILPYPGVSSAVATLGSAYPPDFVWITPNLTNDMHDGTVQQGDAWLRANLGPVLASRWFTGGNATVIVTMDENSGASPGGGQVPMVVISSDATGKGSYAFSGNHYGTLRSIEEAFGLGRLGAAGSSANGDLLGLFGS